MDELIRDFENKMHLEGKSEKTIKIYVASVKEFFRWFNDSFGDVEFKKLYRENILEYVEYCKVIENNIGKEKAEIFEEIVHHLELNKKEKISAEQIYQLSKVSAQEQNRIIDIIIKHPQNSKRIINNAIPYCKVRTTVTLPSFVSDWLEGEHLMIV